MNARSAARKAALIHAWRHTGTTLGSGVCGGDLDSIGCPGRDQAGYRVMHAHRGSSGEKRGGGIAVIYRESIQLSIVDVGKYDEFESLSVKITSSSSSHTIVCIYRPPGNVSGSFCDQFSDLLDRLLIDGKQYIICGDLNCPGEDDALIDHRLHDILTNYNQQQLVLSPTHDINHTLDLLITPELSNNWVSDVSIHSLCFNDHSLVRCRLGFTLRRSPTVTFSCRCIKQIDLIAFRRDIEQSPIFDPKVHSNSVDDYVDLFEKKRSHTDSWRTRASDDENQKTGFWWQSSTVTGCTRCEMWMQASRAAISKVGLCCWQDSLRTGSSCGEREDQIVTLAISAGESYDICRWPEENVAYSTGSVAQFANERSGWGRLWENGNNFISVLFWQGGTYQENHSINPPSHAADQSTASRYCVFRTALVDFGAVSVKEVKKLMNSMSNKSSPLDVLPTSLLKSCVDVFAPVIARMANLSFASGRFPSVFRTAQVQPLLINQGSYVARELSADLQS